ncbi:MAG: amidohydrolase family protein [Acidimicrobiia bacterium]
MIDAYVHCGLSKYQPVESVLATMEASNVARAVLVQHLGEYDNGYLEKVVVLHPGRFTAVALIDPEDHDWEARLSVLVGSPAFCGLRLTADMMVSNPTMGLAAASMGLVPLLYTPDGVTLVHDEISELAASVPERPLVITHLGCPSVAEDQLVDGRGLLELSQLPNVMVTLSGQAMFCAYPHHRLSRFVRDVVEAFTADRILWGSNFPVGGDASDYARDLGLVRSGHWGLAPDQIEQITEGNAAKVFFAAADRKE